MMADQHPLWGILEHQERGLSWLGRQTGYSRQYLWMIRRGIEPLRPEFRRRAARALGLPEAALFSDQIVIEPVIEEVT